MKIRIFRRMPAAIMCLCMIVSLAACTGNPATKDTIPEEPDVGNVLHVFSIDLDFQSELADFTKLIYTMVTATDPELMSALTGATKMSDLYQSKDIYLMTDGTYISAVC